MKIVKFSQSGEDRAQLLLPLHLPTGSPLRPTAMQSATTPGRAAFTVSTDTKPMLVITYLVHLEASLAISTTMKCGNMKLKKS